MKKRTRLLALALAVLMVVGVMPLSVFAIESENTVGKKNYAAPTPKELIESFYSSATEYWAPVWKDFDNDSDTTWNDKYQGASFNYGADSYIGNALASVPAFTVGANGDGPSLTLNKLTAEQKVNLKIIVSM